MGDYTQPSSPSNLAVAPINAQTPALTNVVDAENTNRQASAETTERALRERIRELELMLAGLNSRPTNSTADQVPEALIGTWVSTDVYVSALATRRITISSSGNRLMVHAWESDNTKVVDWGEAPLIGLGTGIDPADTEPQQRAYGLAMLRTAQPEGFHSTKSLYLIIRFDSSGIWTGWSRVVTYPNLHNFSSVYMAPEN